MQTRKSSVIFFFAQLLMVDRKLGVFESMGESYRMVRASGMGFSIAIALISIAMTLITVFIPYVGWVVGWFVSPIGGLLITAAYVRQVDFHAQRADFAQVVMPSSTVRA
jgi:hypothetical protein